MSYAKNPDTGSAEVLDRNDYYPFGMNFVGTGYYSVYDATGTPYNHKYNGKELQETGFYDYGKRQYMPDLGRWFGMDNYSEHYHSLSPYSYAANNPIKFIDINGEYIYIKDKGKTYRYSGGTVQQQDNDGSWANIDGGTELSDFVMQTVAGLQYISNTSVGQTMVSYFDQAGTKNDITFRYTSGDSQVFAGTSNTVDLNSEAKGVWTTEGKDAKYTPLYVTMGHEMAHVYSNFALGQKDEPFERFGDERTTGEIYATHVENIIRAETFQPLRTNYGSDCIINGPCGPHKEGRLIDNSGTSVYYNPNGSAITPIPALEKVLEANKTILYNNFNYYIQAAFSNLKRIGY